MRRIKIVGGGMTGILAAMQAHRLGARQITLYERFDQLGGVAKPDMADGLEIREGCIYFGPRGNPIRDLLEAHGAVFTEFENRFGAMSPGPDEPIYVENFGGPAYASPDITVRAPAGPTLHDRLSCYASGIAGPALDYARWHLGCEPSLIHESAATALAINRIFPADAAADALIEAKRSDPLADELLGIPRSFWGRTDNIMASLPEGGFAAFLIQARRALEQLGVEIIDRRLVTPRQALADHDEGEVLIWAASPTPLFKALGVATPSFLPKKFTTCVFKARWTGPVPFYVQNFMAEGECFRVYIYESAGQTLLSAECVSEPEQAALRRDIGRMLVGSEGSLSLGEKISHSTKPRWIYHTVDTIDQLKLLRSALNERLGAGFVTGAWEDYSKEAKFRDVEAALATALN